MSVPMWFLLIFGVIWFANRAGGGCARDRRELPRERAEASSQLRDRVDELNTRLERLEEERDFYRELLGSGARFRKRGEGAAPSTETLGERVT